MSNKTNGEMAPLYKSQVENAKAIANPQVALADISVDNPLDAGATKINITSSQNTDGTYDVYTADNGCGMSFGGLKTAMKLGSSKKNNQTGKSFGCKGLGMKYGATFLAQDGLLIFTKTKDCKKVNFTHFHISKLHQFPESNDWNALFTFKELELETIRSISCNPLRQS